MTDPKVYDLTYALTKCISACETCASKCLDEDNVSRMARCIRLDMDCADICSLTIRMVSRNSKYRKAAVQLCIEICKECEAECRKHDHDHCRECAAVCHECHKACEAYLNG